MDDAGLADLRAFSARLADVLRPHWPQIFRDYVPVEVRWPDEGGGAYVEVMNESGAEIVRIADAPRQIRRCYLTFLDQLLEVQDDDAARAALEALRPAIAALP